MELTETKLKRCPFCGADVRLIDEKDFYMVQCDNCGAGVTFSVKRYKYDEYGTSEYVGNATQAETIDRWNARALQA